jgi:hypothetical protein
MPSRLTFPDAFTLRIDRLRRAGGDIGPVLPELEKLAWQDNEAGLLAGTDRDGRPLAPLAARTIRYRRSATGRADPHAPPLIPARRRSRAIANYRVTSFRKSTGTWLILGAWANVLSTKGVPFLGFHADGTRHLPVRDIFGVRPEGRRQIGAALKAWIRANWSRP